MSNSDLKYLQLLSKKYTNISHASTEIINLQAILNLPKGTEHFISDVHGEYDSFNHVLRNASGVIKNYIDELFGATLLDYEKKELALLIYYPEQRLEYVKMQESNLRDWFKIHLFRLVLVCKRVSSKYTRSKVRKALPADYAYILEELLHENMDTVHKFEYYNEIMKSIIDLDRSDDFIIAIAKVIQRLVIDHLHVLGDIFDRGESPDKIMDVLCEYHSVDIQWGNHDISWMGAAFGCEALIANVIRIASKYNNLHTLEEGYGINLVPLATFAMEAYKDDPCNEFYPSDSDNINEHEIQIISKMHKAISIIQFKLEAEIVKRNPDFYMNDKIFLDKIFDENSGITLLDSSFPTVNKENPFALTEEEETVINKIKFSFLNCEKLHKHVRFLLNNGSLYTIYNSNLLFHGCIPLNEDGGLRSVTVNGKKVCGKEYLNALEQKVRKGLAMHSHKEKQAALDLMWYLWCGKDSPLFGKNKMTTFERYFFDLKNMEGGKSIVEEHKDFYYKYRDNEEICKMILENFGLCPETSHIINGHVPVKLVKGENPVKANGRLIVIDGGFAKAYQSVTGIAGYTLIYNSKGLQLAAHEPFVSPNESIEKAQDMITTTYYIEQRFQRQKVAETDIGEEIKKNIDDLKKLVKAFSTGVIKEK